MKSSCVQSLCVALAAHRASAFPSGASERRADNPPFDAKSQLVDVSGVHRFVPPGPNDVRGPCPGLNALANHNYLPHNGYIGLLDAVAATREVFGMGEDLATILSAYGGVFDGSVLGWSIGGSPHVGIGGSHNNYETDSSPVRGDLYQYGSNSDVIISQFRDLYDMQPDPATANYNLDILAQFRHKRFNDNGPFSGTIVSQAAFAFIYRFMGNKTAEEPMGILNKEVLKSFCDLYSLTSNIGADISYLAKPTPQITTPGCNTNNTVSSYHQISVSNLTKGTYSQSDALTNPLCFGVAFANILATVISVVDTVVQELLLPAQNLLGCKTIPGLDLTVFDACGGYGDGFYGGPTAMVAKGAVQD